MNCHLENHIRQINHTSLICFAMLEKNRINRNFGFFWSVFGFYRLCQYRLRFRLLKKPRFSVSVTDPALADTQSSVPLRSTCLNHLNLPWRTMSDTSLSL